MKQATHSNGILFGASQAQVDHALVTLWIIVTFTQFKNDELILYPLALYFFWSFLRNFPLLLDLVARSLIIWAFPVWWFLTLAWGTETALIIKSGLQLMLTFMICYCAVLRLSARQIMVSVLLAAGFYGLLSLYMSPVGGIAARGFFDSKNALGMAMVILWIAAFCVAFDSGFPRWVRVLATLFAVLALRLIQISDSATAMLLALAALIIILSVSCLRFLNAAALVTIACFALGSALLLAAAIAFSIPQFDPINDVLAWFGKDTTLTGRTILWEYAMEEIRQHPYLGIGHGGFWKPEDNLSVARRIFDEFQKSVRADFSFHSSHYEIAVHQGFIGLGLVWLATLWCLVLVGYRAVTSRVMPSVFFLCIGMMALAVSFTETGLMSQFSLLSMLLVMGALETLKREATKELPTLLAERGLR